MTTSAVTETPTIEELASVAETTVPKSPKATTEDKIRKKESESAEKVTEIVNPAESETISGLKQEYVIPKGGKTVL